MPIRFLHLADSHVGARHPGGGAGSYLANLRAALAPARRGEVDLVLHAGDLVHRSRPLPRRLAEGAAALLEAAECGADVVLLPGNHERSLLPATLLLAHRRIHLLDRPRRVVLRLSGIDVAVFGFPFVRQDLRGRFEGCLAAAGWPRDRAAVNVLLLHQTLDGARVGPSGHTFRGGPDVIPRAWIPASFDYAALGHIHRHQILRHPEAPDLPLVYAGSTERTSRAERFEAKGFVTGTLEPGSPPGYLFTVLPGAAYPSG
ncbi:MAG: DNA repair exonuclease [Planctomycetes bacterium]|nr:DNA repair exonuclease [Planctomycetota bacterium]